MSSYQGLPPQQSTPQYYDGLEVDMRPTNIAAGLETVPQPDHAGPQVVYSDVPMMQQPDHAGPQAVNYAGDQKHLPSAHANPLASPPLAASGQYAPLEQNGAEQAVAAGSRRRRRRWIWIGLAVTAVLVVGAVVGGIVGSRAAANASSPKAAPAVALKNIRPNSRMAATGWREGSAYHLRLYYQGPDQMLRYSNTTSGAPAWTEPVLLDSLRTPPRANTSLAAAVDIGSASNVSGPPVLALIPIRSGGRGEKSEKTGD